MSSDKCQEKVIQLNSCFTLENVDYSIENSSCQISYKSFNEADYEEEKTCYMYAFYLMIKVCIRREYHQEVNSQRYGVNKYCKTDD